MVTEGLHFPAPRYPELPRAATCLEDLLPAARQAILRTNGRGALGVVPPGEKILIVTPESPLIQDPLVLKAMVTALEERGIHADTTTEVEVGTTTPLSKSDSISSDDGWKEVFWRQQVTDMLPPEIQAQCPSKIAATMVWNPEGQRGLREYLENHPQYTSLFVGIGGRDDYRYALLNEGKRFRDNWVYHTTEDLFSHENAFPADVWKLVEKKAIALIPDCCEVRVTDPQGTEVWWSVTEEEARCWGEVALHTGHLYMFPPAVRGSLCDMPELRGKVKEYFHFPKVQGVIASTTNHTGFYPHLRSYLEDGVVVRIEGSGTYAELLRLVLAKTRNIQFPVYPLPGCFYLSELALGTNPKSFRGRSLFEAYKWFPNIGERNRSGVIHWGFGIHITEPALVKWAKDHNLPHEHSWHQHSLFPTYSLKMRKTGEWVKVIDRGHLRSLDDAEVRALAAKHGDPDEILREEWVPAIPGINYPGDYMNDYGRDPGNWIRKELENRLPETIGVPA